MAQHANDNQQWLARQRERLLERRAQLLHQVREQQEIAADQAESQADEGAALATHPADAASDLAEAEISVTVGLTLQEELHEIDMALERLDNGSYGICIDCGKPISRERLEAIPWALRCIACQERWEARHEVQGAR